MLSLKMVSMVMWKHMLQVSLCEMQEVVLPRGVLVDKVQKQQDGACDPPSTVKGVEICPLNRNFH